LDEEFSTWKEPEGQVVVRVCRALSCTLNGSAELAKEYETCLGLRMGQTTSDGRFTLKESFCFGRCALAANVRINGRFFSRLAPGMAEETLQDFQK
jgi:NADH:ubiquinone oxidoreductase subunit E